MYAQDFQVQQQLVIDSLSQIIRADRSDTTNANAYLGLSEILYVNNLDTMKILCEKAKAIAEVNLQKSSLTPPETKAFKVILSQSLTNIGYYYGEIGDLEKQEEMYLKGLDLIKEVGKKIDIAATLNNVGYLYGQLGEIEKQKKYYLESLNIRKEIEDEEGTALSLYNLGLLLYNQGDITLALDHLFEALKIQEKIDKKDDIASTLNSLGYIYGQQGEIEKQRDFYLKSLVISEETNNKPGVAIIYNNLGSIYKEQNEYDRALEYFNNCLSLSEEIGLIRGVSNSLNNIGTIYEAQGKIPVALEYFRRSLQIREDINDHVGIINSLLSVGRILFKQGEVKKANNRALEALELSKKIGFTDEIKLSADLLQKTYKSMGKYKEGWEAYELHINMRDSVNNIETQKTAIEQSLKYEFEKKEALAAAAREKEVVLAKAESNRQKIIIWSVSIGLLLIVIFSLIIYNRLKVTRKQKILIEKKNKENELLLGEIHHRVKNNLQVISSLLSLQEANITDETAKAAILDGKERVHSMGLIHKMLYQQNDFSGIDMGEYIKTLVTGLLDSFGKNPDQFELNYDIEDIHLDVDTAIPLGLILNELVVNSLKHAFQSIENPKIGLKLHERNNKLILEISDNGKGDLGKVESSTSFGMKLVKSFCRQLNGKFSMEQMDGLSSKVVINDYKMMSV